MSHSRSPSLTSGRICALAVALAFLVLHPGAAEAQKVAKQGASFAKGRKVLKRRSARNRARESRSMRENGMALQIGKSGKLDVLTTKDGNVVGLPQKKIRIYKFDGQKVAVAKIGNGMFQGSYTVMKNGKLVSERKYLDAHTLTFKSLKPLKGTQLLVGRDSGGVRLVSPKTGELVGKSYKKFRFLKDGTFVGVTRKGRNQSHGALMKLDPVSGAELGYYTGF